MICPAWPWFCSSYFFHAEAAFCGIVYDRLGIRELTEKAVAAYFADANLALDALEVAPDRLKPLRELTAELQGRRK